MLPADALIMPIALVGAVRLARANREHYAGLQKRHDDLTSAVAAEGELLRLSRDASYEVLLRFKRAFDRLRHADLADLVDVAIADAGALPSVELRRLRVNAAGSLVALLGGAAAGGTAGAVTFSAVGMAATASTGTAISALSGAAATSATLAWLGGGSLAAGGGGVAAGTTVMTGLVAAPVLLSLIAVLEWQGRRARRGQRETAVEITHAERDLVATQTRLLALCERSAAVRQAVGALCADMLELLPRMEERLSASEDYRAYTPAQRGVVARLASLALTTVTVISAPLEDDDGQPAEVSADAVGSARQLAGRQGAM